MVLKVCVVYNGVCCFCCGWYVCKLCVYVLRLLVGVGVEFVLCSLEE